MQQFFVLSVMISHQFLERKVFHRKLQSVGVVSLNRDLATSKLCLTSPDDLQELVSAYNNILMAALDKHTSLMTEI